MLTVAAGRTVKLNERGLRIGEDHPRAKLTDHDVEMMWHLRETERWGWRRLAKAFDCSRSQARRICLGVQRAQSCAGHRAVPLPEA